MKKYAVLALATVFMFGTTLFAQNQPQPKHQKEGKREFKRVEKKMITPEKRAEFMAKQLELSDAEKAKVQALFEKQAASQKVQMEEIKKMRQEQKAKFEANRKAQEAELVKIIGNEKFQKLQAMQIEHLKKMNRGEKMKMMRKKHMKNEKQRPMRPENNQNKKS